MLSGIAPTFEPCIRTLVNRVRLMLMKVTALVTRRAFRRHPRPCATIELAIHRATS